MLTLHLPPEVVQISATTSLHRVGASVREFLCFGTQSFNSVHLHPCVWRVPMRLHFIVRSYFVFVVFSILAAFMLTGF
jgi:hypothetical protein